MHKQALKQPFFAVFTAFYPHFTLFSTDCSLTVFSTSLLIPFSHKPSLRGGLTKVHDSLRFQGGKNPEFSGYGPPVDGGRPVLGCAGRLNVE